MPDGTKTTTSDEQLWAMFDRLRGRYGRAPSSRECISTGGYIGCRTRLAKELTKWRVAKGLKSYRQQTYERSVKKSYFQNGHKPKPEPKPERQLTEMQRIIRQSMLIERARRQ